MNLNFISKYGRLPLFICVAVFFLYWLIKGFSIILFLLVVFLAFLYRISKTEIVCLDKKAILSPVDGEVVSIENIEHYKLGKCIELSIENPLYKQGIIRACADMSIEEIKLRHGLFLGANSAFKRHNERVFILAKNSLNQFFGLRIFAGCFDRKLKFSDKSSFKSADELGFSINSTVSLLLPRDTRLVVGLNDSIKASSLLGYFS